MLPFLLRHLLESTFFCVLLSLLACCLQRGAAARHAIWLIAVSKFVIPSVLLTSTGAKIAFLWPAGSWLSSVVAEISALLNAALSIFPSGASRSVFAVWALGTAAMFSLWFARLRNIRWPLAVVAEEEQEVFSRASRSLQVGRPVQLRSSQTTTEPALLGIWRPTVTIPQGLYQRLAPAEFETVLLHELAHVRRMDNLTGAFVHCLVCILWFHPLLWLAERRMRVERERACDELVIACGVTPQVYISGILKVCKFHLFDPLAGISAMTGSDLSRRLKLIHAYQSYRPAVYLSRLLIAVAAVLMLTIPIAGGYCEQCVSNDGGVVPQEVERS